MGVFMFSGLLGFWGLSKDGARNVSVHETSSPFSGPLQLEMDRGIAPPWAAGKKVTAYFRGASVVPVQKGDDVLAWFFSGMRRTPAVVKRCGQVVFMFDPEETVKFLTGEGYYTPRAPFYTKIPVNYSRLPRFMKSSLNRVFFSGSGKGGSAFPSWPAEASVEAVRFLFLKSIEAARGRKQKARPFWPRGKRHCAVLTHDIDGKSGFSHTAEIARMEEDAGFRSCWYVIGSRYKIDYKLLDALHGRGHEIGLHGVRHDNRIAFLPQGEIRKRIASCSALMERYEIAGFRSPSLMRSQRLFTVLSGEFSYDSSVPDTDVSSQMGPRSGCCTVFPYLPESSGSLVELPITVPQDASIMKRMDVASDPERALGLWKHKAEWIRSVGGLVNVNTHPDPHFSGNATMKKLYGKFLSALAQDEGAWRALPREAAAHWKGRATADF